MGDDMGSFNHIFVSQDETQLYLWERSRYKIVLKAVDINTGEFIQNIVELERQNTNLLLNYSHDGQRIVLSYEDIFLVDIDGNNLTRLTSGGYPDFSPDDQSIVFVNDDRRLCLIEIETGLSQVLIFNREIRKPVFSPDGNKIYFFDRNFGFCVLYLNNMEVIELIELDGYLKQENSISISYSGNDIAVDLDDKIYHIDSNENITDFDIEGFSVHISHDGEKITFRTGVSLGYKDDVYLMNSDGSDLRKLVETYYNMEGGFFSNDDQKVFFIGYVRRVVHSG